MAIFSILGFLVLCVILGYVSVAYFLLFLNGMGRYNIGGVPNSAMKKVALLIAGIVLCFLWVKLFQYSPFSISLKV